MSNKEIIELTDAHVAGTYARFPIALVKGKGTRVWDADGKEYLDFVSGLAVCNPGHCHPKVVEAIKAQAENLLHVSNLYHIGPQAELAQLLSEHSFGDRTFFCNSGAEANEAAIKLARKYFSSRGVERYQVISMKKSFHGRTFATLAATGQKKVRIGYEPLLETFTYVPFNDLDAIKAAITEKTSAVITEPIQGEGGVNLPDDGYLKGLRKICDDAGVLLIFDEVQVGVGRTGTLFAYENYEVEPDIMTLAKGLGGGMAIGAMVAKESVASAFGPGSHATTFGGNPLASAAAKAAVEAVLDEGMLANCKTQGAYIMERLEELKSKYSFIKEVRGKGLIIGMEMDVPAGPIVTGCMDRGLLLIGAGELVLRFLPALIITREEVDEMMDILVEVLDTVE
ncbi:MAG: aspartate aminotransferase family protein [Proteobacteria bacterium]|nr:aspartate aminotransferase family protein [Pseudomonadota bacterium]